VTSVAVFTFEPPPLKSLRSVAVTSDPWARRDGDLLQLSPPFAAGDGFDPRSDEVFLVD